MKVSHLLIGLITSSFLACSDNNEEALMEDLVEQTAFQRQFEGQMGSYICDILIERREWAYDENGVFDPIEDQSWIQDTMLSVSFFTRVSEFTDSTLYLGKYPFKLVFPPLEPEFLPRNDAILFDGIREKFPYEPELLEYGSFEGGNVYFFPDSDSLSFILPSFSTRRCTETWYGTGVKLP